MIAREKHAENLEHLHGIKNERTLTALDTLAVLHYKKGDYERAIELGKRAYDGAVEGLGFEHSKTVDIRKLLEEFYYSERDVQRLAASGKETQHYYTSKLTT